MRWIFRDRFLNKRVILFVDNDAARFAVLKGGSGNKGMSDLVRPFDFPDLTRRRSAMSQMVLLDRTRGWLLSSCELLR